MRPSRFCRDSFVVLLASETLYGRVPYLPTVGNGGEMSDAGMSAVLVVVLALIGGAVRVHAFSLCLARRVPTQRSGRINLGLEGTLVLGAMTGYAVSYLSGSPWLGVALAGVAGLLLGALHAILCQLPRVNDIAIGIALMQFGPGSRSSSGSHS